MLELKLLFCSLWWDSWFRKYSPMDETIMALVLKILVCFKVSQGTCLKKKIVGLHPQYLWFSAFKVWPYGQEHTFLTGFQVMLPLVWGPHCESLCINDILVGNQKMGKAGCHFNLLVKLSRTQPDIVSLQVLCKLKYIVLNYTGRVL